jgi:hypothetical protein
MRDDSPFDVDMLRSSLVTANVLGFQLGVIEIDADA